MDKYLFVFIGMLFVVVIVYLGSVWFNSQEEAFIVNQLQKHQEFDSNIIKSVLVNLTEQIIKVVDNQEKIIDNQKKIIEGVGIENTTSNFTDVGKISGLLDKPVEILKVK